MRQTWLRFYFGAVGIGIVAAACTHCKKQPGTVTPAEPAPQAKVSAEITKAMDDLTRKWDELKSVSATVKVKINNAAGQAGETAGLGSYMYAIIDGQPHIRFWMHNTYAFNLTDLETKVTYEEVRQFVDGKFHYKYLHQPELKKVTKMQYDPANVLQIGGSLVMQDILANKNVTMVYGEHVDGAPVTVLETTPFEGEGKTRHFFDPTTGIRMQLEQYDSAGAAALTITLSSVKLNPHLDSDVFEPEVPEGFELVDETKSQASVQH